MTYHSLDDSGSVISTSPSVFRQQMEYLARHRVPVVPVAEALESPGAVALTFDDGYRSVLEHALPVLQRYRLPATVFVAAGRCGGRNDWDASSSPAIPSLPLMTWDEIQAVAEGGLELGAHSVHHANLTSLDEEAVDRELSDCRAMIEEHTRCSVEAFAYPFGVSTPSVRRIAKRHFRLACGTALDFVSPLSDRFDLPRLDMYYLRRPFWFESVMNGDALLYIPARGFLRRLRQAF